MQNTRTITLVFILFELCPFELCKQQFLRQNRVRSVTLKPFKVGNFIQILSNIRRRAERKNHNSYIDTFELHPFELFKKQVLDKIVSALYLWNCSRYIHKTSYKYSAPNDEMQSARTITLEYVFFELHPSKVCK